MTLICYLCGFPGGSVSNESACNAGDLGSIPGSGRSPGEGNGNPLQYPCLENSMYRGGWWATVHGITKGQTWLSHQHNRPKTTGPSIVDMAIEALSFSWRAFPEKIDYPNLEIHSLSFWILSALCFTRKLGCKEIDTTEQLTLSLGLFMFSSPTT